MIDQDAKIAAKEKFLKGKINEHIELLALIETITSSIQKRMIQKQELLQQHNEILSELPLHKINDDIFDIDSEVLKSEKHHVEFVINDAIEELGLLDGIKTIILTYCKKHEKILISSDYTSEDANPSLAAMSLSVYADYDNGNISVSGDTDRTGDVTIKVTAENGDLVSVDQVTPSGGTYSSTIKVSLDGTYTVSAQQDGTVSAYMLSVAVSSSEPSGTSSTGSVSPTT